MPLAMMTQLMWLCAVTTLNRVNPVATLWTLIIPYFVSSFALMFGNWCAKSLETHCLLNPIHHYIGLACGLNNATSIFHYGFSLSHLRTINYHMPRLLDDRSQHIFVDPSKPESDYSLTYNCVAAKDNQQTFNDGYHVIHHVNSRLHWSEMPQKFIDTIQKHGEEDGED